MPNKTIYQKEIGGVTGVRHPMHGVLVTMGTVHAETKSHDQCITDTRYADTDTDTVISKKHRHTDTSKI